MKFSFNNQDISFTSEPSHALSRYILPGGHVSAVEHDCLKLLLQEFTAEESRLYYTIHISDKKCNFKVRDDGPFFMTCISLQHDQHFELKDLGNIHIREGQYNLIYSPDFELQSQGDPGKEHIYLTIQYDKSLLQEWSQYFPALNDFLEAMEQDRPAVLTNEPVWMTREIQETVYRILHTHLAEPGRQVYFSLLVKTLLFHLLNQSVQQQPASKYSNYEVEGIQAASEMIRKNLKYHFAIREIAQKVGMNEFKLKNGFRELFGNGVYEYLRTERMQEARNLLEVRGKSVKEIAALTGYHSVNSFIKAFKKKFGKTPGEFRKRA